MTNVSYINYEAYVQKHTAYTYESYERPDTHMKV